jgi:hypothetical protein
MKIITYTMQVKVPDETATDVVTNSLNTATEYAGEDVYGPVAWPEGWEISIMRSGGVVTVPDEPGTSEECNTFSLDRQAEDLWRSSRKLHDSHAVDDSHVQTIGDVLGPTGVEDLTRIFEV